MPAGASVTPIVNKERFVVHATRYRRSLLTVPTGAIGIVFWLLALVAFMIVICVVAAVTFTVRLTAKFVVMVCRNLFRYFPG